MRRRRRSGNDQADVNMTPMLDIVFILLIFFIVTATFLQEEGVDMRPPPPSPNPPQEATPPILISVDADNNVFVNNERTSALRVPAAVARIRAEEPDAAVVISPNNEAEHGLIVEMYDALRRDSIPTIITRPDED